MLALHLALASLLVSHSSCFANRGTDGSRSTYILDHVVTFIVAFEFDSIVYHSYAIRDLVNAMKSRVQMELVRDQIVGRILSGKIESGLLNESALAETLGTSRTPVREALLTLPSLVSKLDSRGFELRPLDVREIREIYPIVGSLECLALDFHIDEPTEPLLAKLRKLNVRLRTAANPASAVVADNAWHAMLLSGCRNRTLLRIVSELKLVARRYDILYWDRSDLLQKSTKQHDLIIANLGKKDIPGAKKILLENWMDGCEAISRILEWR
jgi:DNA-binding GntR family transcriptional regulator